VAFTGTGVIPVGPGLAWNSGLNSLTDITGGTVDVQTAVFDARGIISVAPGAVLRAQSGFTMTDTSSLEFFVDGPVSDEANYGRFELGDGVFAANGTVVTTPLNGYAPTGDTYPLIACPSGSCLDGTFDEVFGGRIESRTANEIGFVLVNTYVGPTAALVPGNWANTLGWSFGLVPDATDDAAIPGGQFVRVTSGQFSVGSLTVAGDLRVVDTASGAGDRQLTINEDSVIEEAGRLFVGGSFDCTVGDGRVTPVPPFPDDECVPSVTTLQLSADLRVDGDLQVVPRVFDYGTYQLVSDPVFELDSGASLSGGFGAFGGTVLLSGQVVKSEPGTVTFGPDLDVQLFYGAGNDTRGVLEVTGGTLDIQSAPPNGSFTANGTIEVGPGATVSIADDLALSASSVLEFGIDGPAAFPANFGRVVLPTGSLTADGTLRTVLDSYTPSFDDIYSVITCATGSCVGGGSFDSLDADPLTLTSTTSAIRLRGPELPVELAFDLERTSSPTVRVGSSAISVESFDRTAVTAAGGATTDVAASSLTSISADDNSLAAVPLRDTLIAEIILQSDTLRAIPLVSIDIGGGWTRIIAGNPVLEREAITSLTLGQVLDTGPISNETTPAGRVGAIPLGAINVQGTPLGAIPLGAIALGSTPLGAIPLGAIASEPSPWCEVLEGFLQVGETCETALLELTVTEVALRGAPLGAIPLGAIPLGAIDLEASPLGAIPLGAIDLEASPLGAIPLGAIPLGAIGVAGSPLGAIPLGAIPLGAIPLGAIDLVDAPLGAIPLGAIELDADVLADLPTSLVLEEPASGRVVGAPLGAIPLGAILLADVPLGAIPLEENGVPLDWCAVLADAAPEFACTPQTLSATTIAELAVQGVPLGAIPLGAIPLGAIPLGAIDIGSTPLGAIPLGAIPLGAIPLGAIPLGAIPLGAIPLGAIDIADAPLGAIPLGAIPLGAIDIAGSPLGAIPLGAIPLGAIPLGAIPLGAIPLGAIPLGAIPLGAIDIANSPLGAITVSTPLGPIPLGAIPLGAIDIAGSPLGAIPLGAIPLGAITFDCALVDCDNGVLRDAVRANAVQGDPLLSDLSGALDGIRVGDLVGYIDGVSEAELRAAIDATNGTMANLSTLDDLTLADLPAGLQALLDVQLEDLGDGLDVVTLADVVGAIIDPATGRPFDGIEQNLADAIIALDRTIADLDTLGDITLNDLFFADGSAPDGTTLTLDAIEPILGFITVESFEDVFGLTVRIPDEKLADLANAGELGDLTLADLSNALLGTFDLADLLGELGLAGVLDGYTLADLLLALLDPSSRALGGISLARVDVSALPDGSVSTATFASTFTVTSSRVRPVSIEVPIPSGAAYASGTATISVGGSTPTPLEPTVSGRTLVWTITAQPGVAHVIEFGVLPPVALGVVEIDAFGKVEGTDVASTARAAVTVEEGLEPINFINVDDTVKSDDGDVFLTYLSSASDVDVFEVTLQQDERLVVGLSELDADLDLVLWGRPAASSVALTRTSDEAPLFPITDPDGTANDAEPLDDFTQLDAIDPTLGIIGVSNLGGTTPESLATGRLAAGTYYIQVIGANNVTNVLPAALQIKVLAADEAPVCQAIDFPFLNPAPAGLPDPDALDAADTLILVNEQRLVRLYGEQARLDVMEAAQNLVDAAADPALGISPVVVSVDAYQAVRDAYDAWDTYAGSCDPNAANNVVAAINDNIVDDKRGELEHLVILGGDELIPMARLADRTLIANEYDFRHEFDGDLSNGLSEAGTEASANGLNAFTAPFWNSMIRSDEPYGDAAARSLGDRFLYVSDIALGRVVETPAQIVDALETYVTYSGRLDIETATVLGYDFLSDGSEEIADTLELTNAADGTPLPVDRDLASGGPGDGWTKQDAVDRVDAAGRNALVSLNAHFDHYRALPAIGDKDPLFTDNLLAADVAKALEGRELEQSLIFSMGCHSGLSVSDITIGNTTDDWAQTLGDAGSLYIGNTGYGYGDTKIVAYTEHLMSLFARQVTSPFDLGDGTTVSSSTVGQALTWAKNEYISGLQTFSVYDEKAVMESTFYGLPFYRVGTTPAPLPEPVVNEPVPDATGTESIEQTVQTGGVAGPVSTSLGTTYYANLDDDGNELVIAAPGRPIQPKQVSDISVIDPANRTELAQLARGAIVLGMESTYVVEENPAINSPTFVGGASLPEATVVEGVFPTKQVEITSTTGPAGRRQTLVVATGQYDSETKLQRLDSDIDVVVYYADLNEDDVTAPTIASVTSSISNSVLTVSLAAGDASAPSAVDRVYVLVAQNPGSVTEPTSWTGLDLVRVAGSNVWTGSLNLEPDTTSVELTIQAKDQVGNVGYATNKARNFAQPVVTPPPPPPPPPTQLTVDVEEPPLSGWYEGSATISIPVAATDVTYSINDVSMGTLTPPASFDIGGNGVQNWTVTTIDGKWSAAGSVNIDSDGPPDVSFGAPVEDGVYVTGTRTLSAICADAGVPVCSYTITPAGGGTPTTVTNGSPLPAEPGAYTLSYLATDRVGQSTTGEIDFEIVVRAAAPVLGAVEIDDAPQPTGVDVTLLSSFTDLSAPYDSYSVSIDWGDGSLPDGDVVVTAPDGAAAGTIQATHVYDEFGIFEVTVTIEDSTTRSDTATTNVTIFDPLAAPKIVSIDPVGVTPITEPVEISAQFDDGSVPVEDTFSAVIDWGDGTSTTAEVAAPTLDALGTIVGSKTYAAPGTYDIIVTVRDSLNNSDDERIIVDVVALEGTPFITSVSGPSTPQDIADGVTLGAAFTDASAPFDSFTATIDWGDGAGPVPAAVTAPLTSDGEGTISGSKVYTAAGVYSVTVTVTDANGDSYAEDYEFIVVFDPDTNGRVSGSGYYWSGAEAFPEGSRWGAPAFFGYDARYKKNATVPTGDTQLRLLGEFFFRSTSYDYLIVNDAIAIAEGVGKIGTKQYRFRVQGIDNGWLDFFQITIWDPANGNEVVYDNGVLYDKGDLVLLGGIKVKS
jgi:hypothetical protein